MRKTGKITCFVAGIALCISLAGCTANTDRWAYIHEPDKEVLALSDNGKAVFKGDKYTYTKDDTFIVLKDSSGASFDHRYVMDGEKMIFYERSTYTRDGGSASDGIAGMWRQDNGWSFEFTSEGTFSEEGFFVGRYAVDEAAGTIKLMYADPIEDSLLYYSLDGDELTIDYPWPMVHVTKEQ
ncbi:MAG: hypothetical protein K6E68_10550 [Lachnospiraceae bacterium]|jgi:hypothetical protein|nr:hypothetical protein [Lachnospiraceae bacterium]